MMDVQGTPKLLHPDAPADCECSGSAIHWCGLNRDTGLYEVERCDACAVFGSDQLAADWARPWIAQNMHLDTSPPPTPQHTPGPWKLEHTSGGDGGGCCVTVGGLPPRSGIAYVQAQADDPYGHARNANARLIAAAPDLLATLAGLLEHCAMVHRQWGDGSNKAEADAHIERARQLVAAHH